MNNIPPMFLVLIAVLFVWIGICGIFGLYFSVFKDEIINTIVSCGLIFISCFTFAGYFVGKERGREIGRNQGEENENK